MGTLYYAVLLQEGTGVPADPARAAALYEQVVQMPDINGSHALAAHSLGALYHSGNGVEQDYETALDWFIQAAEAGHAEAAFRVGYANWQGEGVAQNDTTAAVWLRRAAERGHTGAMGGLMAVLLAMGGDANLIEAYAWGSLAADYDPAQRMTAGRFMIRERLTPEQIVKSEQLREQWRERLTTDQ